MRTNMDKWLEHNFSSGTSAGYDYLRFQKEARVEIKKMAAEYGLVLHSFSNNHYTFSAVLKAETDTGDKFVYVSINDVRSDSNHWWNKILYRTMEHDKDWSGGRNMRCHWTEIGKRAFELVKNS